MSDPRGSPLPPSGTPRVPRPLVLLVLEDDVQVRGYLATVLDAAGYHVRAVPDPRAAFRDLTEYRGPIDLVLTDVVMPGMNGIDFLRTIWMSRPGVRVLVMSGYPRAVLSDGTAGEPLTDLLHPALPFLAKPFTLDQLLAAVADAFVRVPIDPGTFARRWHRVTPPDGIDRRRAGD